jgi:hypothetical protein
MDEIADGKNGEGLQDRWEGGGEKDKKGSEGDHVDYEGQEGDGGGGGGHSIALTIALNSESMHLVYEKALRCSAAPSAYLVCATPHRAQPWALALLMRSLLRLSFESRYR